MERLLPQHRFKFLLRLEVELELAKAQVTARDPFLQFPNLWKICEQCLHFLLHWVHAPSNQGFGVGPD
uniref:Uncharacterized protein n=1 Tax=Brassica oleracea TaxID=3712 RepID=A0A3P6DTX2_BRAOL|nr:unnamed protein product [Brassica oleracea]